MRQDLFDIQRTIDGLTSALALPSSGSLLNSLLAGASTRPAATQLMRTLLAAYVAAALRWMAASSAGEAPAVCIGRGDGYTTGRGDGCNSVGSKARCHAGCVKGEGYWACPSAENQI
jgi:hypothetical protein